MNTDQNLHALYVKLGANIAYLRKERNLTQEELATALNVHSQSLISQYEHARKALSLERIADFCSYFNVSLEEMLFKDFSGFESRKTENTDSQITTPIQKCSGRTYYCYYLKEQNKGKFQFTTQIARFEIAVLQSELSHQAPVKLVISSEKKHNEIDGLLRMDESYAYISCHDESTDFFLGLTFFYHRQRRKSEKYAGGMALLQTLDYHILPVSQLCIVSSNAISSKRYPELKKFLEIDTNPNRNINPSKHVFSSKAILRLTKEKDSLVVDWPKQNINIL